MRHSHNYEFFRTYNRFGLKHVFYRNFQSHGYETNVQPYLQQPSIITANHQNSLIDALNLAAAVKKELQPFFMTRSDVFGSFFDRILYSWKLRPIFRAQDNIGDVAEANEVIFDEMVKELGLGDRVIIFPEGNHSRIRRLRPLKKGFARIGFQAEEKHEFSLDLLIQPVGINYWEHLYPGAEVLVNFGPPIRFKDFYELYQQNPNRALIEIRKTLFESMKQLIHHVSNETHYEVIDAVREFSGSTLLLEEGKDPSDLHLRFQMEKLVISTLEHRILEHDPHWESFASSVIQYRDALTRAGVTDEEVSTQPASAMSLWLRGALFFVGAPIFVVAAALNYLPYGFADRTARRKFKDDHFHSSIRFAVPLFLYPAYWIILWLLGWLVTGSLGVSLAWLVGLVGSAGFALVYWRKWRDFRRDWIWSRIRRKPEGEALIASRPSWFRQLRTWITADPLVRS